MIVRALKPHGNRYGRKWRKRAGDTYDAGDDADLLVGAGLVELVETADAAGAAARS
jgi:hypothetical protein